MKKFLIILAVALWASCPLAAVITVLQPSFIADTEAEKSTSWPDGSEVTVRATGKQYRWLSGAWVQTGGPGLATMVVVNPVRPINSTAFQPSSASIVYASYTVSVTSGLTLTTGSYGYIVLEMSANGSTGWVEQTRVSNGNTGTLTIGVNTNNVQGVSLGCWVPTGYYLRMRSVTVSGTPVFAFIESQETTFN